ncbi:ATP-dependent Lon protease [Metamycoplasma subdolum]|uniref:Lon protease n=1 Tax=Metamycoplasma subdolum TaxID=92407 RepID=A0A3M0AIV5_9BACT|nr:endopeptidase La [Metamycoplasma subdolum]RMA79042.1 ATP-dependent Lon protease [Metamycoplasma subdolum]WPB50565.1 endopeptidase La [Metamycoplasma subdolum]
MKVPFIAIRNQIILPFSTGSFKVGRKSSLETIDIIEKYDDTLLIAFVKEGVDEKEEIVSVDQIEKFGSVSFDPQIEWVSPKVAKISVTTNSKVKIKSITASKKDGGILVADIEDIKPATGLTVKELEEYRNKVVEALKTVPAKHKGRLTEALEEFIQSERRPKMADDYETDSWIQLGLFKEEFNNQEKLDLLLNSKISDRYEYIASRLISHKNLEKIDAEIEKSLHDDLSEQQREFLLREKMKQIQKLLDESDDQNRFNKIENDEITKEQYPEYVLDAVKQQQSRLGAMMPSSPEANVAKTYIDLIWQLPWRKISREIIDLNNVRETLDKNHYGLKKPKERILEFVSVLIHNKNQEKEEEYLPIKDEPDMFIDRKLFMHNKLGQPNTSVANNIPILTLIGPPGTGKTTLAKAIAEALNRKFIKVSLGGVKDEAEIRGHRRTYVGAMPGKIINAIKKAGVSNPVILLDEIDKMSADFRGDPVSAMLEVLDPEQNVSFQDHYLDLEYDLSKVLFIATANSFETIPAPLIDRVEILELSTYTAKEKLKIAQKYLVPKILKQNSLTEKQFQIDEKVLEFIIASYTRESGVRELKRILDSIARKIVVKILDGKVKNEFVVTVENVVEALGPIRFENEKNENIDQIGVTNGLAYTSVGGTTLPIEVTTFPGKEGLKLTGQLKDVMRESAQIALGYVRSNAKKFGIDFNFDDNIIHIHVPEGAIPKDGPSAGVTFTTSIISALSRKPVPAYIGMTGEITLRGKILPIGGLKEKSLAASQFGITKIFIPWENEKNLIDLPEEVKKIMTFIPVKYYSEIFDHIFKNQKSISKGDEKVTKKTSSKTTKSVKKETKK